MHIPRERKHITLSAFSGLPPNHLDAESWSQDLSLGSGAHVTDSTGSGFSRA